jgi:hypothetical protein
MITGVICYFNNNKARRIENNKILISNNDIKKVNDKKYTYNRWKKYKKQLKDIRKSDEKNDEYNNKLI